MSFNLKRFEVLVEPKDHYKCGDRVNCILVIDIIGVLKCKHILITAMGQVFAYGFYRVNEMNVTTNILQIPFNFGHLVGHEVITTGIYRVPFSFLLQNLALPTHKTEFGHIRYFVEAVIDKYLATDFFHRTATEFIVKTNSNIHLQDMRSMPMAANCEKLIRTRGIKVGSVRLSAHIDRNIYYKGENIQISFHLDDRSSKPIRLSTQLNQKTAFKHDYMSLDSQETVSLCRSDVCQGNSSLSSIFFLNIPHNCISTLNSPLITVDYEILFFFDISNSFEYFNAIPIFIA